MTITSDEFLCNVCHHPANIQKAGMGCQKCPAFQGTHYYAKSAGDAGYDIIVLGDSPPAPTLTLVYGTESASFQHSAFSDDAGKVMRSAIETLQESKAYRAAQLRARYLYAVKCAVDNPNKETVTCCRTPLLDEFERISRSRAQQNKTTPLTVVACGLIALKALGVGAHSFAEAQGRVYETVFGNIPVRIVVTMSLAAIGASAGKYSSLLSDLDRAFRIATDSSIKVLSREELEAGYIYPRTNAEVTELVDMVLGYTGNKGDPANWAISIDTETNTLHPHRDGLRLLTVQVGWDRGKAASIALWHPGLDSWVTSDAYDPQKAWEQCRRLLVCAKPKIGHNIGYDLKVFRKMGCGVNNVAWDCMLSEHVLEEDKRGQYGLKFLTKQHIPEYSGYEDKLHDLLEAEEGEDQSQSILKKQASKIVLPVRVEEALEHLGLSSRFRVDTLRKKIAAWSVDDGETNGQKIADAQLLIAAKEAGEFKATKGSSKKKEREGGFEKIPLPDLAFYGCVDADVTRQLAIIQRKRMNEEDVELWKQRNRVIKDQSMRRASNAFTVPILYPHADPLGTLAKSVYIPRMHALMKLEYDGIKVNTPYLHESEDRLDEVVKRTEEQIYEMVGTRFPINSSPKLAYYLTSTGLGFKHPDMAVAQQAAERYPKLVQIVDGRVAYESISKTKLGAVQMTEKVLKTYKQQFGCPLSNLILVYKKASKARGTFLKNVRILSSLDGFMHPRYNLNGTSTGRLSSSNMNMQNVPKGELGGVKCKRLFIPDDDGMVFCNADAKGAEVVIYSGYSRDPGLIEALRQGMDAHCFFSANVLNPDKVAGNLVGEKRRLALALAGIDDEHGWTYDDFLAGKNGHHPDKKYGSKLKDLRDIVKKVVFGILYGAGKRKIAEIVGIDEALAASIIKLLFEMFPTLPLFIEQTKWELRTFNMVETYYGRRRRFSIRNAPKKLLAQAERRAVNFKIQSTNSDIVMDVFCAVADVIERDLGGRMLLTVHDSLGFQVPKKYVGQVSDILTEYGTKRVNAKHPWLPVAYKWDVEMGSSYGDLVPAADYMSQNADELARITASDETRFEGYTEEEQYEDLREAVADEATSAA